MFQLDALVILRAKEHLVEMSASFTKQLNCLQRIFVCFMQIATENDIKSHIHAPSVNIMNNSSKLVISLLELVNRNHDGYCQFSGSSSNECLFELGRMQRYQFCDQSISFCGDISA